MTIDIGTAILSLNKKGGNSHEFVIKGNPTTEAKYKTQVKFVSGVDSSNNTSIFSDTQPYTWTQVNTEKTALQTAYDNNEYKRDRASEYPSIQDQLDMQYWDNVNSTTTWKDAIAKVKSDNPKGD